MEFNTLLMNDAPRLFVPCNHEVNELLLMKYYFLFRDRNSFHPPQQIAPQAPQPQRFPSAPQHRPTEQLTRIQQRQQDDHNVNPAQSRPRPPQQNRNVSPASNRPPPAQPLQSRPQQGLTGLLQRILGVGDRRKENSPVEIILPHRPPPRAPVSAKADSPLVTFQGPLPPIIASKIQSAQRPLIDGNRRSDKPSPNVLDQFSASIIKGGPVLGLPGSPVKAVISDAEKSQLERFLFGPAEHYTPRSFPAGYILR